ncbi:MAG: single-stranded DNA-binding protein [Bacteroidetes bacterium]|jgi:single-strand DNA-binding protein|nr:MAG: single-stranded DNA-binding protein [Bacteroidota bacterium]
MSNLKNRVTLIGHVGQSPEVKSFDAKGKLARFSLATNESYKNSKGEKIDETQWHNVVAWSKLAEIVEAHVEKGSYLVLEGKIVNRSYETKEGEKRYVTEIVANELNFLTPKKDKAA